MGKLTVVSVNKHYITGLSDVYYTKYDKETKSTRLVFDILFNININIHAQKIKSYIMQWFSF